MGVGRYHPDQGLLPLGVRGASGNSEFVYIVRHARHLVEEPSSKAHQTSEDLRKHLPDYQHCLRRRFELLTGNPRATLGKRLRPSSNLRNFFPPNDYPVPLRTCTSLA
ncbi:hypothetical protein D3C84_783130 [compost metagenome]